MSYILSVKHLTVSAKQDGRIIDNDIDFNIGKGESLVVLGESGSGKTMICRAVFSLLSNKIFSVKGTVSFDGKEILQTTHSGIYGKEIVLIPQNPMTAFDPSVRVGKQICETLRMHRKTTRQGAKKAVTDALKSVGLESAERVYNSYPHTLSGGMLQRAVIAMALVVKPRLIIADEPTTALDAEHRESVISTLLKIKESGTSVMLITHDFVAARQFGGDSIVMKDGEIIERGTIDEISFRPKSSYCRSLISASQLTVALRKELAAC